MTGLLQQTIKACRCGATASVNKSETCQSWVSCDARPTCGWTESVAIFYGKYESARQAAITKWNAGEILWWSEREERQRKRFGI